MLSQSMEPEATAPAAEGINVLPNELLYEVLRHIPTRALLLSVCSVSRRFRETCNTLLLHRLLWLSKRKNGIFRSKLWNPARANSEFHRHCAFLGTTESPMEGMNLSRIYGVYTPIIPFPVGSPHRCRAPHLINVVLEKDEHFAQLRADGLFWHDFYETWETSPVTVFADTAFQLTRKDLVRMAELGEEKLIWLNGLKVVGFLIKVEARDGGWDNNNDRIDVVIECGNVAFRDEHLLMLVEEQREKYWLRV